VLDRDKLLGADEFEIPDESEEEEFDFDDVASASRSEMFLGMTPVERMFISIFLFMNVTVLGIALLLATGRIGG
jgi:hypothetical protein